MNQLQSNQNETRNRIYRNRTLTLYLGYCIFYIGVLLEEFTGEVRLLIVDLDNKLYISLIDEREDAAEV